VAGFVFFRACDVLKPWPARFFDRDPRWKNGAGVVLDERPKGAASFEYPTHCPCPLHTPLAREVQGEDAEGQPIYGVVRRCTVAIVRATAGSMRRRIGVG